MSFCGFIFVLLLATSTHLAGVLGDVTCSGKSDRCDPGWKYVNRAQHSVCIQIFDKENYDDAVKMCKDRDGKILGDLQALEQCFDELEGRRHPNVSAIWGSPRKDKCSIWRVNNQKQKSKPCDIKRYFLCEKPSSPSTTAPPTPPQTTTTPITTTMTTTPTTTPITTTTPMTTTTTTTQPSTTTKTTPMTTTTTTTQPSTTTKTTPMTTTMTMTTTEQDFSCPDPDSSKCSEGWLHVGRGLCLMHMNKPSELQTLEEANQYCGKWLARLLKEEEITPLFRAMIGCQANFETPIRVDLSIKERSVWLQQGCKTIELQGLQVDLNECLQTQNVQQLVCAADVGETVPDVPEFDPLRFLFGPQTMPVDTSIDSDFKIETPPVQPTTSMTRSTTASMTTLKATKTEGSCPVYEKTVCPGSDWVSVGVGRCLRAYPTPIKEWDKAQQECEKNNSRLITSEEFDLVLPSCLSEVLSHSGIRSLPEPILKLSSVWLDDCKRVRLSQNEIIYEKRGTSCPLQDLVYPLCAVNVSIRDSTTTESTGETGPTRPDTQWESYEGAGDGEDWIPDDTEGERYREGSGDPLKDDDNYMTEDSFTYMPEHHKERMDTGEPGRDGHTHTQREDSKEDFFPPRGEGEWGPRDPDDTPNRDFEDFFRPRGEDELGTRDPGDTQKGGFADTGEPGHDGHTHTQREDSKEGASDRGRGSSGSRQGASDRGRGSSGSRQDTGEPGRDGHTHTQREDSKEAQDTPQTGKDREFAETATVLGILVVVIPVVLVTIIAADIIAIAVYKNRDRLMRHFGLLPISDKRDLKNAEEGNVDADVNDTGSEEAKNEDDQGEGRASNGIEEKKATNEAGAEKPGEEGGAAKSGDEDNQKASSDEKGEEKASDGTEEKTDKDKKEEKTGEDKEEEKPGGEKGGESSDEKKEEKTGEDKGEEKPDGGKEDKSGDGKGEGKSGEEKEGEKSLDKEACEKSEGSNTEEKSGERDAKAPDGEKEEEKTSAEKEKKETSSESDGEKSDEGKGDNSEDSEEEDND